MQDLVVCVGESCHQSGAELVLKSFMEIIAQENLEDKICLKGSFCIGKCCDKEEVSVRWGEKVFQTTFQSADHAFVSEVWPDLSLGRPAPTLKSED